MRDSLTLNAAGPKDFLLSLARELFDRRATRAALAIEVPQELASALAATALSGRDEPQVDAVEVRFEADAVHLEARLRMAGRAWPPRPPIDTRVRFAAENLRLEPGSPGALLFQVGEPLSFSSPLAQTAAGAAGLVGKTKLLPLRIDELRRKGAALRLDLALLLERLPPELAGLSDAVRVRSLTLAPGRVRIELAFAEPRAEDAGHAIEGR